MIGNEFTQSTGRRTSIAAWDDSVDTTISALRRSQSLAAKNINDVPAGLNLAWSRAADHGTNAAAWRTGEVDMDWGFAETMAYASA